MSFIDTCTEMLISAIKNGSAYRQYCAALEEIKKTPGLKEQVDELRRLNYQIQNESNNINLDTTLEKLDEKMEKLCRIVEVNQFLDAEMALCRQLQEISAAVHQGIYLDIPDLS